MNRIDQIFKNKHGHVLSIYMTAGYPRLESTVEIIKYLQAYGADMIEIGMPFSDPLADGPVIQASSKIALQNGMNISLLFDQLAGIREEVSIPLVLMGYLNPVLQYGFENFLRDCRSVGIDGLILPDLPLDVFESDYKALCDAYGIYLSMLITPHTSTERVEKIASLSGGFLYMVADAATTGVRDHISDRQINYFKRIGEMNLEIPRLIGFGISNHETFETACRHADGAIIGSAFIKAIEESDDLESSVMPFLQRFKKQGI